MLALKFLFKFIRILNKDASPREIAGGMALGSVAGLTPLASLHNLVVLFVVVILKVNMTAAILAVGVFSAVGYLLDPLSNRIGWLLLAGIPALKPFWTALYNTPVVPWTRFNNTLTLGSLVLSLILLWPIYLLLRWAVVKYREKVMTAVRKWRIVTIFSGSRLFGLYQRFS
jgi:uncharacterized protein (TIGR03546 family)